MKRRIFATIFIFIIGTQVFPVQGFQFWYHLLRYQNEIEAPIVQVIEEERFEQHQLKLKSVDNNHSFFLEYHAFLASANNKIRVILSLGNAIDRSDPILIPPPNRFI